ncbi:DNA-binding transcriptional regulator, LysR family [Natronincola peptidivorans]|uniref:DNA-binding transcriptional regulator, LysR family n=1 Tax=Natronincola peptidivorans TaxID=426128 RepID=A0A1I0BSX6_9FIRM|nr:LysR family transcriptional regulator [Natronincola peptidivorans]SET10069.1 DNA-binding transcriptional regulator, LysR family [Natronincola peptidivorans]
MNLQYLRAFYVTVKLNSISKAAKELHLTQPGLSMQIQSLEKELAVTLLIRSNKGVELTQAGTVVFDYANTILSMQGNIERDLENLKTNKKDLLIGSCKAVGEYALPCSIYIYKQSHECVDINYHITNSEEVMNNLCDRTINVGIVHNYTEREGITLERITSDRLILVTTLPVLKNKITLDELKMLPLIFREMGSGTRATIQQYLKPHNVEMKDLNIIYELNSMEAIKTSVLSGKGISFIPELTIKRELKDEVLREIEIENVNMISTFYIAYREDYKFASFESDFVDFIMSSNRGFC